MRKKCLFCALFILLISFLFDKEIIFFISRYRVGYLNDFMIFMSLIGNSFFVLFLVSLYFVFKKEKKNILNLIILVLVALFFTWILKILVGRVRPEFSLISVRGYSFPSGHATGIFAVLNFLNNNKWFFVFAVLVCFSRIYLGVHYVSDVVAGILIGYFTSEFLKHKLFKEKAKEKGYE